MTVSLQITARNTDMDQASEQLVRRHVAKLAQLQPRLSRCGVIVEVPQRHPVGAPMSYAVRLELRVARDAVVVTRRGRSTLSGAIQAAFGAARRRLRDTSRRRGVGRRRVARPRAGPVSVSDELQQEVSYVGR